MNVAAMFENYHSSASFRSNSMKAEKSSTTHIARSTYLFTPENATICIPLSPTENPCWRKRDANTKVKLSPRRFPLSCGVSAVVKNADNTFELGQAGVLNLRPRSESACVHKSPGKVYSANYSAL